MKDMEFGLSPERVLESKSESETKRQILEKLAKRKELLGCGPMDGNFCAELNPDVIVISDDSSLLFEPQNLQVTEWLRQRFRLDTENLKSRERMRVHPSQQRGIITELKAAGFTVAS